MRIGAAIVILFSLSNPNAQETDRRATPASQPAAKPATSQPTSRSSSQPTTRPTTRRPDQVRMFQELLQKADQPGVVLPQGSSEVKPTNGVATLPEGTTIAERSGRLVRAGDHWEFQLFRDDVQPGLQGIEVLKCELLDQMERLAQSGAAEFVVSGELTSYRGQNFLLIRKVRKQLDHRNLSP